MASDENKEKALNLLIEAYKLYAAFCAVIIAGLLSYASSATELSQSPLFKTSIVTLSLCSVFCIVGIQYFISEVYNGDYNIYAFPAKIIFSIVMLLLIIGISTGLSCLMIQDTSKAKIYVSSNILLRVSK